MNCARWSEMIYDYLDGDLEDQARRELEIHLEKCEGCQLELAASKQGIDIYRSWGAAVEPDAEFTNAVLARLTSVQSAFAYRIVRGVGLGLISVLAILAFFVAPVLYSLARVLLDLFVHILPLIGILLATFPFAQTVTLAVLAILLAGMTWAMRQVIEY